MEHLEHFYYSQYMYITKDRAKCAVDTFCFAEYFMFNQIDILHCSLLKLQFTLAVTEVCND